MLVLTYLSNIVKNATNKRKQLFKKWRLQRQQYKQEKELNLINTKQDTINQQNAGNNTIITQSN